VSFTSRRDSKIRISVVELLYSFVDVHTLTLRVYALSLATGELHPLGSKQPILTTVHVHRNITSMKLSISDNHIGLMAYGSLMFTEFWIWDWTTGELKLVGGPFLLFSDIADMVVGSEYLWERP
jgi:hypothetical protein